MPCFWTLIFLCFALYGNQLSQAEHHHRQNKLPSSSAATVVGTVYCDTCFHRHLPKTQSNPFIAGATIAVECRSSSTSRPTFRQEVKTNSRGEFRVQLPFTVGKRVNRIRGCSVALIRSSQPFCAAAAAAAATSSSLRLKSRRSGGEQVFSAGFFTFKPQVCDQKRSSANGAADRKPSPKMAFILPPNPLNPPVLPPNPLLPPPSLLPPVLPTPPPSVLPPFFPTPPPSVFPPFLPTPPSSPSPFLPLPPIPWLTPSPPPPPPLSLPVPLPPLPFLPPVPFLPPLIPGGPPHMRTSHP